MGAALRLTWTLMSAATLRGYGAVRTLGALPGRYLHWSQVFLNADNKQCKSGERLVLSEQEWRSRLTPEQYYVCRQKGTEPAFSGEFYHNHRAGIYTCAGCGAPLFSSQTKYDSGSGWPSFYEVLKVQNEKSNVVSKMDTSHGMVREEVLCKQCDSHLGHVFDDGPAPTGKRFCINSASLNFTPDKPKG